MYKNLHLMIDFKLWDININSVSEQQLMEFIETVIQHNEQAYIITPNPEIMLISRTNPEFKTIIQHSKLNISDGVCIAWAYYFLNNLPQVTAKNKFIRFIHVSVQVISTSFKKFITPKPILRDFPVLPGSEMLKLLTRVYTTRDFSIFLL